ncbi:MAG: hypothetical protein V3S45_06690 [Kiloniellales bacterium]
MSGDFLVRPLASSRVQEAFPLVSVFHRDLSEDAWSEYAAAFVELPENGHGIMTVQSDAGYIHGLSAYHVKFELRRGAVLQVENFVVMDLFGAKRVAKMLLHALEGVARSRHCHCMSLTLLDPRMRRWMRETQRPAPDLFAAAGFRGEPLRLRKCFDEGA